MIRKEWQEKSEIKYTQLYKKTQELGYSFSNKTLYHVLSYQETSLNIMAVLAICQVLDDLDFMQQFRKEFLPLLQILKKDCYIFKATELIAYTGSNMKKENRLRAIMLIKQAACASEEINNEHDNQGVDGVQRLFKTGILKGIEEP